jgi:hypothetical protein
METDSERNIRIGKTMGAIVVQASGTIVGVQEERTPLTEWKRDQIDQAVRDAILKGATHPEEILQIKLDKIAQLRGL